MNRLMLMVIAGSMAMVSGTSVAEQAKIERLNPDTMPKSPFKSQAVVVDNAGKFVHIAGETAVATNFHVQGDTLDGQLTDALQNFDYALAAAKSDRDHVVALNVFFVAKSGEEPKTITPRLQAYFKDHGYPAVTFIGTPALVAPGMLIEIEGTATVPN
ncbi:enamine deaminase RidA (YjgF/YER057c/UK114 family) [Nitrospirillum amazonense]|uniref:Enamine deaminase RidA (YjgF/YER057c/UK114 family) n=1 Tax=Nitrospirillum amazonense TaxID=28077 RepID=A0A560ESR3_9PROT|nr:RidA family protein [Nitrospirillum amazonense]TWB12411.1 enamine deaminase RidA (YjgF/YER057c/UK114 family) [Nitrospirillum amazonense]